MPTETYEDAINILKAQAHESADNQLVVDTMLVTAKFLEEKKVELTKQANEEK